MEQPGLIIYFALILVTLAYLLLYELTYRRIRRLHSDRWGELGFADLGNNYSLGGITSMHRFLWGRHYLNWPDRRLTQLAVWCKLCFLAIWPLLVIMAFFVPPMKPLFRDLG